MILGQSRRGFTLIELLVVISIIALLISLLLPALSAARRSAQKMKNMSQLRGIHQSLVTYATDNDQYYPGIDPPVASAEHFSTSEANEGTFVRGRAVESVYDASWAEDMAVGYTPAVRWSLLLENGYVDPQILHAPADGERFVGDDVEQVMWEPGGIETVPNSKFFYSYSMIKLSTPGGNFYPNLIDEWKSTGSSRSIMLSDRLVRSEYSNESAPNTYLSYWTQGISEQPGDWGGHIAFNDGHVRSEPVGEVEGTQYGQGTLNDHGDRLFTWDSAGDPVTKADCRMIVGINGTFQE